LLRPRGCLDWEIALFETTKAGFGLFCFPELGIPNTFRRPL
jgi:hypothetical protein